jgi:large subunit ribosomal protein L15
MEDKGLHNLAPADGSTKERKRVGRGPGSGTGKRSGRGQKGQKSRSGSHMMRAGFEGGQNPLYMRISKLRGSTKKMSMPMGPFRTHTQPVNLEQLAAFEAGTEVTPALLLQAGILRHLRHPVKVLGRGELGVKLTVTAHGFSKSAREAIEAAGGTVNVIEPTQYRPKGVRKDGSTKAERAAAREAGSRPAAKAAAAPAADASADTDAADA